MQQAAGEGFFQCTLACEGRTTSASRNLLTISKYSLLTISKQTQKTVLNIRNFSICAGTTAHNAPESAHRRCGLLWQYTPLWDLVQRH